MSGTILGEWVETILAVALLPAHIASYVLPLYFCWRFIRRFVANDALVSEGREQRRKNFWGAYLLLSGLTLFGLFQDDPFLRYQGAWKIACGMAIFLLGSSWWAPRAQKSKVPR
jgi:hypothetical protein